MKNKKSGVYITFLLFALLLLFLLIFIISPKNLNISLPIYFFLLVICDLAATTFLTMVLKTSAEYNGKVYNGNLQVTGAAVVFFVIVFIGYKFRPVENDKPFDLTFHLRTPENSPVKGTLSIEVNNAIMEYAIDQNGSVTFPSIDPNYSGKMIPVSAHIEGYTISEKRDTFIEVPKSNPYLIRLPLYIKVDTLMFSGFVLNWKKNKTGEPLKNVKVYFAGFNKETQTDSLGKFMIFLPAKQRDNADVKIFQNNQMIYFNQETLSTNMQILIDQNPTK